MVENIEEIRAVSRFVRGSHKKYQLIVELIRNKPVPQAFAILRLLRNKKLRVPVLKTLESAVANALEKYGKEKLTEEDLIVTGAVVDRGPIMKRYRPAPRGRAVMIRKRFSHITVKVARRQ